MKVNPSIYASKPIPPAALAASARAEALRASAHPEGRLKRPDWDSNDPEVMNRMALGELAKLGVSFDNSTDKSSLLKARGDLRRAVNELSNRATDAANNGDRVEAVRLAEVNNEIGRMIDKLNKNIDAQDHAERYHGTAGETFGNADGKNIVILNKNESFAEACKNDCPPGVTLGGLMAGMARPTKSDAIRNALSEGSDGAGGVTVPQFLVGKVIDQMRARMVSIKAGAKTLPLETNVTKIARLLSDPAAAWRLEAGAVADSDPTFDAVTLTARSLAVKFDISQELLADSANVEQALMAAVAGALAVELDRVCLVGSGTAPEPKGIFYQTGINSVSMGTNGAAITDYQDILDSIYELEQDNAPEPTAMIMAPRTRRALNGLLDTTNQPMRLPTAIENLPQLITTSMPINQTQGTATNASSIIVGDFSQLLLGIRNELRIEVLKTDKWASNLQYTFLAFLRADVAVLRPQAFCKLVGIIPAA